MSNATDEFKVIDGDGHVIEYVDDIVKFMPRPYRDRVMGMQVFPPLDHHHSAFMADVPPRAFRMVNDKDWVAFMDHAGFEATVVYPTFGLAVGKYVEHHFARAATRAYNDWLHERYTGPAPRIHGMGLVPMDDPGYAVEEMHRVVEELGFAGVMLPSNLIKGTLGAKEFHPLYAAAEKLGCALAVHGGCHDNFGINDFSSFAAYHAVGHTHGQIISLTSMLFAGVFDKFPGLRVGFLEGGLAWVLTVLERCAGSHGAFKPYDPAGELLRLEDGETMGDYMLRHFREGRIYIGIEGDEPDLAHAVSRLGAGPFVFSSDFPHEVNEDTIREELGELHADPGLSRADKRGVLRDNAARLYGIAA